MSTLLSQETDITGVTTTMVVEDGQLKVNYSQDVSGHLDRNQNLANADEYAKQGIKDNLQHIGHIPDSVCLKMMVEDGFDVYRAHASETFAFLRKHRDKYSKLLVMRGRF
jgi:hypothetical protein